MIVDLNCFNNIESFINHVKEIDNVIGILEYGGRTYTDMTIGGDYDLTIIFDKPISGNFTGFHFHIGNIPVDCMLLSKDEFEKDSPLNEFLLVHLNCKIIYDKNGVTANLLKKIKQAWTRNGGITESEITLYRFSFRHILDKLKYRLEDNVLYTKYFVYSSFDWYLSCYANIKGWEIGKPKLHFKLIEENESELFILLNKLYSESDLYKIYNLLEECAEYMLKDIGGLWRRNEVLFHLTPEGINDDEEQSEIIELLFGEVGI